MSAWYIVAPAILSAIILIAVWRPWRSPEILASHAAWWGGAIAIGIGYLAGHWLIARPFEAPPTDVEDWIFIVAAAAIIIGVAESVPGLSGWMRWAARIGLAVTAIWLALRYYVRDPIALGLITAGISAATLACWRIIDIGARNLRNAVPTVALVLAVIAAAAVIVFSGNSRIGFLAAALGAAVFPWAAVAMWRPAISLERGGVAVICVTLAALLTYNCVAANVIDDGARLKLYLAAALTALAPIMPWLVSRIVPTTTPFARRDAAAPAMMLTTTDNTSTTPVNGWRLALIQLIATITPLAIAVTLAFLTYQEDAGGVGESMY